MCSACVDMNALAENYKEQDLLKQTENHLEAWIQKNKSGSCTDEMESAHMIENEELLVKTRNNLAKLCQEAVILEAQRSTAACTGYGFMVASTFCMGLNPIDSRFSSMQSMLS